MKTPREVSPLNLMQERYRDDPWALLIGCILFNMVHGSKAQPIHEEFLRRWPSAEFFEGEMRYAYLTIKEMIELFAPLGFQNRRADRIVKMTHDFLVLRPDLNENLSVTNLHGCGKYASDSFNIFYRGYLVEDVSDKELKSYVSWAKSRQAEAHPEGNGQSL